MNEYIKLQIDAVAHSLFICGENTDNPILLAIHGGPGQAETAYIRHYQKELEKHFVVVRHDQRGAGLTGWEHVDEKSLTIETCVEDTLAITEYLLKRFNKNKIYIMGHSWGSIIAILAAKRSPEFYHSYIGVSQVVDYNEAMRLGYIAINEQAKKQNRQDVLNLLCKIGAPPYSGKTYSIYSRCIGKMSGFIKTKPLYGIGKAIFKSNTYPLKEKPLYYFNAIKSGKVIFKNGINIHLLEQMKELAVPVTFISGKHDLSTPLVLVEKFYQNISAPKKQLVVLENSAHMPQLEEFDAFNKTIITIKNQSCHPLQNTQ